MNLLVSLALVASGAQWLFWLAWFDEPAPWWAASMLAASFVSAYLVGPRGTGRVSSAARAILRLLPVLSIQSALVPLGWRLFLERDQVDWLASITGVVMRALGQRTFDQDGVLYLPSPDGLLALTLDWEKLALFPLILSGAGATVWILADGTKGVARRLAALWGAIALYVPLRFAVMAVLLGQSADPTDAAATAGFAVDLFRDPRWQLVSLLPLFVCLAPLFGSLAMGSMGAVGSVGSVGSEVAAWRRAVSGRFAAAAALIAAAAFTATGFFLYHDPGMEKDGRILIDDAHSARWGPASPAFDRSTYGRESVYNFRSMADLIGRRHAVRIHDEGPLSADALDDADVLVIKTPTVAFTTEEIDRIDRFVRAGGGLFLIGDHTNLLGMSDHLNRLGERFGITFNLDATNRASDGGFHTYRAHPLFPHPITQGLPRIEFMTSCTLTASMAAEAVMPAGNTFSDALDYSSPSFFGDARPSPDDSFGPHHVCVAAKAGRGRVVAFADSTILSNFGVFYPGRAEFVLRVMQYLNRRNETGPEPSQAFLLWSALLAVASFALVATRRGRRTFLARAAPVSVACGIACAGLFFAARTAAAYPPVCIDDEAVDVAFVADGCEFLLEPALVDSTAPLHVAYDTFFVWTQRMGFFPRVDGLEGALTAEVVVLLNPTRRFSGAEIDALQRYVRGGGRLLVMTSMWTRESTADTILQPFEMGIACAYRAEDNDFSDPKWLRTFLGQETLSEDLALRFGPVETRPLDATIHTPALTVRGGHAAYRTTDGRTLVALRDYGEGRVVAVAEASTFSRAVMGLQTDDAPVGDPRRDVFDLEYRLFEEFLLGRGAAGS